MSKHRCDTISYTRESRGTGSRLAEISAGPSTPTVSHLPVSLNPSRTINDFKRRSICSALSIQPSTILTAMAGLATSTLLGVLFFASLPDLPCQLCQVHLVVSPTITFSSQSASDPFMISDRHRWYPHFPFISNQTRRPMAITEPRPCPELVASTHGPPRAVPLNSGHSK